MGRMEDNLIAAGRVIAAVGVGTNVRGGVVAANGVGDHNLTLDEACDATECSIQVTVENAAAHCATVVHTSDTVKQILTWTAAGAAADVNYSVTVRKFATGTSF